MNSPQSVEIGRAASVLRRLFEIIDGLDAARCVELLAPDLRFSVVFSKGPGDAQDFAGDRRAFDDYLAQRGAPSWTHHVLVESAHRVLAHSSYRDVEVVLGETRQDGVPVATFVAAVRLAADGRIDRYVVGRSPAVLFDLA
jgi:ketosteroid isomerase-like protein